MPDQTKNHVVRDSTSHGTGEMMRVRGRRDPPGLLDKTARLAAILNRIELDGESGTDQAPPYSKPDGYTPASRHGFGEIAFSELAQKWRVTIWLCPTGRVTESP